MEQHYIVVFGIVGENAHKTYTICIIVSKYPEKPYKLLQQLYQTIEDVSIETLGILIKSDTITIKSLTRVF